MQCSLSLSRSLALSTTSEPAAHPNEDNEKCAGKKVDQKSTHNEIAYANIVT